MEDDELILEPLTAIYDDVTIDTITGYKVYIDTLEYTMTDGIINGTDLYDGQHLLRLEWKAKEQSFSYEKTVTRFYTIADIMIHFRNMIKFNICHTLFSQSFRILKSFQNVSALSPHHPRRYVQ